MADMMRLPVDENGNAFPALCPCFDPIIINAPNGSASTAQLLPEGVYIVSAALSILLKIDAASDTAVAVDDFTLFVYLVPSVLFITGDRRYVSVWGLTGATNVSFQRCG